MTPPRIVIRGKRFDITDPTDLEKINLNFDQLFRDVRALAEVTNAVVPDSSVPPVQPRQTAVYASAAQTIPTTIWTPLTFDQQIINAGHLHDLATPSRFTIPVGGAGVWWFGVHVFWATINSSGQRIIGLTKNGSFVGPFDLEIGRTLYAIFMRYTTLLVAAEGDYYESNAYQDSGSPLDTGSSTASSANRFQAFFLG